VAKPRREKRKNSKCGVGWGKAALRWKKGSSGIKGETRMEKTLGGWGSTVYEMDESRLTPRVHVQRGWPVFNQGKVQEIWRGKSRKSKKRLSARQLAALGPAGGLGGN